MIAPATNGRRPRLRARRGMTLIELMIAVFVLAVGLLALAGVATSVGRQVTSGGLTTKAALVAQSRFDSLTSLPCSAGALGGMGTGDYAETAAPSPGITERWSVEDGMNIKTLRDTILVRGRRSPLVYETVIPCRD